MGDKRLMRLQDVVEYIGFGKSFIYDEISAGRFPSSVSIKEKSIRWLREDIDEWIDNQVEKHRQKYSEEHSENPA